MTLVLHVLPADLARGAQTYARELRLALDSDRVRHRTLTLFDAEPGALRPDITIGVESGFLRRAGVDPRALWRFRRALGREQPTVVVVHGGEPLKYAVLAGVRGSRLVYYKIGIAGTGLTGSRRRLHRFMLARAGIVAAVSRAAATEAMQLGVSKARLRVIPNGRDPAAFRPHARVVDEEEDPTDQTVRLAYVGHVTASKRPLLFIELVRTLRSEGLSVSAAIAGDGPLLDEAREAARTAGVDVLGMVSDVPELLARSDLLVFTSVPVGEGMPGVLIEAGLAGLPVVTTDVPGASDVVADGQTGFVVPVDDWSALVHATRTLVEDRCLRERLGQEARARCAENFSLDASVREWRALLDDVMGC